MPQLDPFTYLTQFVWLCVCFMSAYIFLYNEFLPKISRILKLRSLLASGVAPKPEIRTENKTNMSSTANQISGRPNGHLEADLKVVSSCGQAVRDRRSEDVVLIECLKGCTSYCGTCMSVASQWCNEMVKNLNSTPKACGALNKSYLRYFVEMSLSHMVKRNTLDKIAPAIAYEMSNGAGLTPLSPERKGPLVQTQTQTQKVGGAVGRKMSSLNRLFVLRLLQKVSVSVVGHKITQSSISPKLTPAKATPAKATPAKAAPAKAAPAKKAPAKAASSRKKKSPNA